ncbi:MAG TPA: lipopolysaccharide heptosyltransferase I [Acidobacteriota bacterium]|jgi:lipopolysaccharide heptosyltransferase I|nr:lipopolysaccharide heptosyltransferase I [Acidobacteriota bacterium]
MNGSRFLIVKLSAIGDVVHTLPALMDLRLQYPESEIDWLVEPSAAPLLRNSGELQRVIEVSTREWRRTPFSLATLRNVAGIIADLRRRRYQAALDFQGLWKSGVLARSSGAAQVFGINSEDLRESSARVLYHRQAKAAGRVHRIERNRAMLKLLGIPPSGPARYPEKLWNDADRLRVESLLENLPEDFVIVNPGGGWATKLWPPERFGELARCIHDRYGYGVVCTWGPGEEALVEQLKTHASPAPIFAIALSISEFACFVRSCRLFIGGDTGPMHIAAAYGVPVFSIFGPTTVEKNGPYQTRHHVVQHLLPCSHCYLRSCWHHSCMRYLETNEVWQAFQEFDTKISDKVGIVSRKSQVESRKS